MIYCGSVSGSGSDFEKVLVPVLVLDPASLAQFSKNKKIVQNLAFSMSEAALFPKKLASHF